MAIIAALLSSCSSNKFKNSLPVSLGESKEKVKSILGNPNRRGENFESYYDHGLVINYDSTGSVISITATLLNSGVSYKGEVFGISLGDDVSECINKWGNSLKWEETTFEYNLAQWIIEGNILELEIWNTDGNDISFGSYKKGTVKQITLKK